jgi:hypothetical protein
MTLRAGTEFVSTTELATIRLCMRMWWFLYGLKRESTKPKPEALTKGTAGHKALGAHHTGKPVDWSAMTPDIRALVRAYQAWYGTPDRTFVCEQTDVPFQVALEGGVVLVGEFDGIGVRKDTGKRVIHEIKTTSDQVSPGSPYWVKIANLEPQATNYLLASEAKGWGHTEILWDVLKKPDIRRLKATPEDKRKLKKDGTPYATTRLSDESDDELEQRCLADIAERPEHYFQRAAIVRLEHEHKAHVRDIYGTVRLIQLAREMGEDTPRNTDACFKYGSGKPCQFYEVCSGVADINDPTMYQERKRKKSEPERAPAPSGGRYVF